MPPLQRQFSFHKMFTKLVIGKFAIAGSLRSRTCGMHQFQFFMRKLSGMPEFYQQLLFPFRKRNVPGGESLFGRLLRWSKSSYSVWPSTASWSFLRIVDICNSETFNLSPFIISMLLLSRQNGMHQHLSHVRYLTTCLLQAYCDALLACGTVVHDGLKRKYNFCCACLQSQH